MKHYSTLTKTKKKFITAALATLLLVPLTGVSAVFTDSTSTQVQDLNTGTGSLEITGGSLETKATSSVEDLIPGDSVTRDLFLSNAASYDLATISLEVTDSETGQPMTTDGEGLNMVIERETAPGIWELIYGPAASIGAPVMSNIEGPALMSGGIDHLRVTQRFVGPDEDKSLKDKAAQLTYIFTGTQRDGNSTAPTPVALEVTSVSANYTPNNIELAWVPGANNPASTTYSVERDTTQLSTNQAVDHSTIAQGLTGVTYSTPLPPAGQAYSYQIVATAPNATAASAPAVSSSGEQTFSGIAITHLNTLASAVGLSNINSSSSSVYAPHTADRLLDGDVNTFSSTYGTTAGDYWQFELPTNHSMSVSSYQIQLRNDYSEHAPRSWVLEGSTDGSSWSAIHNVNSYGGMVWRDPQGRGTVYTFYPSSNSAYKFLRFKATGVNQVGNYLGQPHYLIQAAALNFYGTLYK